MTLTKNLRSTSLFLSNGIRQVFFRKSKKSHEQPFSLFIIYPFIFTVFSYANTETPILSRKLPAGFLDNTSSFRVPIRVLPADIEQPFSLTSFHLPERAGHSPDKAPLALHIGFQIFRALPVCLPDCFRIIEMFHDCTGGAVPTLHPGRYALAHRV